MSDNAGRCQPFAYHAEDLNCADCLYRKPKSERENKNTGCGEEACRFEDIRRSAVSGGRVKRPAGGSRWDM